MSDNTMDVKFKFGLCGFKDKRSLVFVSLLFMVVLVFSLFIFVYGGASFFISGAETPHIVVRGEAELLSAIEVAPVGVGYVIGLGGDVVLESSLEVPVGKNITLVGVGGVRELVGANNQDTVVVVGLLTIDGICVTHTIGDSGRGVYVKRGGTFILSGSSVISGNAVDDLGGGVFNDGTFVMLGGKIINNTAMAGGGVYNAGTWDVGRDGAIWGNTATNEPDHFFNDVAEVCRYPRP